LVSTNEDPGLTERESSNSHSLSESITHNTHKKQVQSIKNPQERENIINFVASLLAAGENFTDALS